VGEALRHALAEVLRENEIRDSDLEGVSVTITQVKPSPDMRYATVYCEPLGGENAKVIIAALNRHKGFPEFAISDAFFWCKCAYCVDERGLNAGANLRPYINFVPGQRRNGFQDLLLNVLVIHEGTTREVR